MSGSLRRGSYRGTIGFCLLFLLYVALSFAVIHIVRTKTDVLHLFAVKVAQISSRLISLVGVETRTADSVVFQNQGFAIDISYKCAGILLMAFFSAGILAYPCPFPKKLVGLLLGIPLLFLINLLRLVGLFLVGTFIPPMFDFVHKGLAEVLMILAAFVIWWFWLKKVSLKASLEGAKNWE